MATRKKADEAKETVELSEGAGAAVDPAADPEPEVTERDQMTVMLQDAQEMIAKMMADAKAEARRIIDEAKSVSDGAVRSAAPFKPAIAEEKVTIQLFKDNGKYASDMFVGVNGVGYQIKRGIPVEVPRSVAEVLEQSMAQDAATAMMIEEKKSEG